MVGDNGCALCLDENPIEEGTALQGNLDCGGFSLLRSVCDSREEDGTLAGVYADREP